MGANKGATDSDCLFLSFCLADVQHPASFPPIFPFPLLAPQDLAHLQYQNAKQKKEEFDERHASSGTTFRKGKS